MGQAKQLLEIRGISLLRRAIQIAREATRTEPVVVLGARADLLREHLSESSALTVMNDDWESGMGSSVASGVSALLHHYPGAAACLLMLVDQPMVDESVLTRLIQAYRAGHAPLVVCAYAQTTGVPALFAQQLFPELMALHGEKGAKSLLRKYADQARVMPCPEAGLDLDTPRDWSDFLDTLGDSFS